MDKPFRNEFIDKDTSEDLYEKLLNKRITVQRRMKELTKVRTDEYAGMPEEELNKEFEINWVLSGIWYYEGLKYMLELDKNFKVYLFSNRKYVYEVIPSEDMNLFDYNKYQESNEFVSYRDCFQAFDGVEESFEHEKSNYPHFTKYHGVIWRLNPGFTLRLLYECVKNEPIDKDKKYYRFYFKSMNEDITFQN